MSMSRRVKVAAWFLFVLALVVGFFFLFGERITPMMFPSPEVQIERTLISLESRLTTEAEKRNLELKAHDMSLLEMDKLGYHRDHLREAAAFKGRIFSAKSDGGKELFRVEVLLWVSDPSDYFGLTTLHFEAKVRQPSIWEFRKVSSPSEGKDLARDLVTRLQRDLRLNEMK